MKWIYDRYPDPENPEDHNDLGYVWMWSYGEKKPVIASVDVLSDFERQGSVVLPWMPITMLPIDIIPICERFVVVKKSTGYGIVDRITDKLIARQIPSKEMADAIEKQYNEAYND